MECCNMLELVGIDRFLRCLIRNYYQDTIRFSNQAFHYPMSYLTINTTPWGWFKFWPSARILYFCHHTWVQSRAMVG